MTDEKPMAAMFDHCCNVYAKMMASAIPEPETDYFLWEGYLTNLFQDMGLASPYYTAVTRHLKTMGCMEQTGRGGGARKSQWRLVREPSEDAFKASVKRKPPKTGTHAGLIQQVNDLARRVAVAEDKIDQLMGVGDK